jgi:hypothetical protein
LSTGAFFYWRFAEIDSRHGIAAPGNAPQEFLRVRRKSVRMRPNPLRMRRDFKYMRTASLHRRTDSKLMRSPSKYMRTGFKYMRMSLKDMRTGSKYMRRDLKYMRRNFPRTSLSPPDSLEPLRQGGKGSFIRPGQ